MVVGWRLVPLREVGGLVAPAVVVGGEFVVPRRAPQGARRPGGVGVEGGIERPIAGAGLKLKLEPNWQAPVMNPPTRQCHY